MATKMFGHHADHPPAHPELHVPTYRPLHRQPRPEFELSAAPSPYTTYSELNDPYLEDYFSKPRIRKLLLDHGVVHPKDYSVIFSTTDGGRKLDIQETIRRVQAYARTKRSAHPPERQFWPYMPRPMRRLRNDTLTMSDGHVRNHPLTRLTDPLDYVVLRLEEQLLAVKHAAYLNKQPIIAKNMRDYGFLGFEYEHLDLSKKEDIRRKAILDREQNAVRHFEERMHVDHKKRRPKSAKSPVARPAGIPHVSKIPQTNTRPPLIAVKPLNPRRLRKRPKTAPRLGGSKKSPNKNVAGVKLPIKTRPATADGTRFRSKTPARDNTPPSSPKGKMAPKQHELKGKTPSRSPGKK